MFASLGLTEHEEAVYDALLRRSKASLLELVSITGLPRKRVVESLDTLGTKGFVNVAAGEGLTYTATPPDRAVEPLIIERQEELERVRAAAVALVEQLRLEPARASLDNVTEQLVGPRARRQWFLRMQREAKHEVKILDKPPYAIGGNRPPPNTVEQERLLQGIRYRVIYDPAGLTGDRVAWISDFVARGEEARVFPSVPIKIVIADDLLATVGPTESGDAILVHRSPLLDALNVLFELLWEKAPPFRSVQRSSSARPDQVLALMAQGLKDEAIARELGVTKRTVERRIGELIRSLGVRTRFQAGLEAQRRGLLG